MVLQEYLIIFPDLDEGQLDIIPVEIQGHALPNNITISDKFGPSNSKPKGT